MELFNFEEELKKLPDKPGVYLMHGTKDEIIYVGKAVVLKNRVRQYFQDSRNKSPKIEKMVRQITRFEYIITDSELEALVLECNLIKEHQPKYNTMLKDGKTYPYICVTVSEDFPRVFQTRNYQPHKSQNRYFGPYTSLGAVKHTLELIHNLYRIRTCNRHLTLEPGTERACLNYHMKQCDAPCCGLISKEAYGKNVEKALALLGGKYEEVVRELTGKMQAASEEMDYEQAIYYRDLIDDVKYIGGEQQKITDERDTDRDIIALAVEEEDAVAACFFVRDGKMIGREHFHIQVAKGDSHEKIMTSFVKQFYAGTPFIPREIFLQTPLEAEEQEGIENWLTTLRTRGKTTTGGGRTVHFVIPKKGRKEHLVELARKNAELVLNQDREKLRREELRTTLAMKELSDALGLVDAVRVEAFDISNISGVLSVGSMVVFEKGKPMKHDYRKFRIKTVVGPDDYASMREVLTRRFTEGIEERKLLREQGLHNTSKGRFARFPDLIMMDGGKGQVHIAQEVLDSLGLHIPVCGMVKDDRHRTRGLYYEDREIMMDCTGDMFAMITRIQDEAHRFAIEYHRSLRSKESVHSVLDDINGIGPKRRLALMRAFGDIEAIKQASEDELGRAEGMNQRAARAVYTFFHPQQQPDGI